MSHEIPDTPAAAQPEPDAPAAAATARTESERQARGAFKRYAVMAIVTGVFLLLLTAEMIMKYVFQLNGVNPDGSARAVMGSWIAIVHGWIYVIYLLTVFFLWSTMRWSTGRLVVLVLGGVVPFLSFVMEAVAAKWFAADLPARLDRAAQLASRAR